MLSDAAIGQSGRRQDERCATIGDELDSANVRKSSAKRTSVGN